MGRFRRCKGDGHLVYAIKPYGSAGRGTFARHKNLT
jgi:hypothetical protein